MIARDLAAALLPVGWLLVVPAFYVGQHARALGHTRGIHRAHRQSIHGGTAAALCLVLAVLVVLGRLP